MSQVHIHLLITHLPIFGSMFGALVLGYGLGTESNQTKNAAYLTFIISAIGAGIAYFTGEGAEKAVRNIQGVSKDMIELHAGSAEYTLVSLIVLGLASVFALIISRYKASFIRPTSIIILVLSIISFGLAARTGYLGGQIRHTEVSAEAIQNTGEGDRQKEDH